MRAVIYTRVSTEEQAKEGFSLDAQLEKCQKYIELQDWEYIADYTDDGYSAKNLKRPAMQKLLKDMEQKQFELVVIYRLDRLVRRVSDLHYLMDQFKKYDIKFVSINEHFDTTTATGRLFLTNVAALAEWERENLAERVRMGQEQRALRGKRNGATPPYGYKFGSGNSLVVDPIEATIVKRIFELYLSHGFRTIARILNSEGVRTSGGHHWTDATIDYVLDNVVYIGKLRWGYRKDTKGGKRKRKAHKENWVFYDGAHEPIIETSLWDETQQIRAKRQDLYYMKTAKSLTSDYPFSAVTFCNRCGHALQGTKRKRKQGYKYTYICPGNYKHKICNLPSLAEAEIESKFMDYLEHIFNSDDIKTYRPPIALKSIENDDHIIKQIDQIKKTRRKWQIAFGNDLITIDELQSLMTESREKEKQLLTMLNSDKKQTAPLSTEKFLSTLSNMRTMWRELTRQERKQLILSLVKTITIDSPINGKGTGTKSTATPCVIDKIIFN